jgi:hypothetical protein
VFAELWVFVVCWVVLQTSNVGRETNLTSVYNDNANIIAKII